MKYAKFKKIDGTHPWRKACPDGYVDYPVRYRKGGRVTYFNFALAKELGLITRQHPHRFNPALEKVILDTFSLQIINEHDQKNIDKIPANQIRPGQYMATRYLQLQHANKQGKTSGDGRSIWNGFIKTSKMHYDISSRGTGTTILSPGAQEAKRPIRTGSEYYGYSSGLADSDEMLASAVISEIFYRSNFPTERCLAVIDYGNKTSIGVRVAPNLIRPAHIFRYLKLDDWTGTKNSFDYFFRRQERNRVIKLPRQGKKRYAAALDYLTTTYAKLVAVLEEEYIFNWLAWDGDNMLADGAILDYGSIRRFAGKNNKYRYEDSDRYSASLSEQRYWARQIIQRFIQTSDFIVTRNKKVLESFKDHPDLKLFDQCFEKERQKRMLFRVGFADSKIEKLIKHNQRLISEFQSMLNYFEELKTVKGEQRVPDGIDHPPIFLVRGILRELPAYLLKHWKAKAWPVMPEKLFCELMAASYVVRKDLHLTTSRKQKASRFQQLYHQLIEAAGTNPKHTLQTIHKRSQVINYEYRGTGDGLTLIVEDAIEAQTKVKRQHLQEEIERFIESQVLVPGKWKPFQKHELKKQTKKAARLRKIQRRLKEFAEAI